MFANKTSNFVASWYRPPGGDLATLESQLMSFKSQLEKIKDIQLLPIFFLDSDFCHNYLHTPVVLK